MVSKKNKLDVISEGINGNLTVDELCKKHGIHRTTYYRWRRELISAGLSLLQDQENQTENSLLKLKEQNTQLERKVNRLEEAKATWELRCKWLWWQLERVNDPDLKKFLASWKKQMPQAGDTGVK